MRAIVLACVVWAWASLAGAQAPVLTPGTSGSLHADQPNPEAVTAYLVTVAGAVSRMLPAAAVLTGSAIEIPITITATNGAAQATSEPLLVQFQPAPVTLGPCTFIAKGSTVVEQRPIGYVLEGFISYVVGNSASVTASAEREWQFRDWGWNTISWPESPGVIRFRGKCKGVPVP